MSEENKYKRGKIYKITCDEEPDKVYIGSTCEPALARRLAGHRKDYKNFTKGNRNHKVTSFDIIKHSSATITLIESYPCNSRDELHKRERFWIEQFGGSVNKVIPTRTTAEYNEANKDNIRAQQKQYRENNKEIIKNRAAKYRDNNRDKIKEMNEKYRETSKEKRKAYREANKEKIKMKKKEYADANRDVIIEKKREHYRQNKEAINARRRAKRAEKRAMLDDQSEESEE